MSSKINQNGMTGKAYFHLHEILGYNPVIRCCNWVTTQIWSRYGATRGAKTGKALYISADNLFFCNYSA